MTFSNINKTMLNPSRIIIVGTQESWRDHRWDFKEFLVPRLNEPPEDTKKVHPVKWVNLKWRTPQIWTWIDFGYPSAQCCSELVGSGLGAESIILWKYIGQNTGAFSLWKTAMVTWNNGFWRSKWQMLSRKVGGTLVSPACISEFSLMVSQL